MEIFDHKVPIKTLKPNIKRLIMYRHLTSKSNHKQMYHSPDSKLTKANLIHPQRMKKRYISNISAIRNRSIVPQQSQQEKTNHLHQIEQRQELNQNNNIKAGSKKCLWDMFQKYCNELKDLKQLFDVKYSRLKMIEERINGLIIDNAQNYGPMESINDIELQVGLDLDDNNYKISNQSPLSLNFPNNNEDILNQSNNRNNVNNFKQSLAIVKSNKNAQYESNDLFEPIIDIKEELDEDSDRNNDEKEYFISNVETGVKPGVTKEEAVRKLKPTYQDSSSKIPSAIKIANNGTIKKNVHHPVFSKHEFMQLVEQYKQEGTLVKERLSSTVFMLRRANDYTIIGYQCSIDDCSYMHYLRAQVNRHYKNYHSKTCWQCNQRFKRPIELQLHLKNQHNIDENTDSNHIL